jgi:hypothetical protein
MKQTILTISIVAGLLSAAPIVQARDYDRDRSDDLRSDVHSLWEWYGHLNDEANARGGRHTRDELDAIRYNLKRVDGELADRHSHGDRVRGEIDGIRDDLRHVNSELKWHGEVHHREGFTINIR